MIEVNRRRSGKVSNVCFGLMQILDGLIRVSSFGFLHSSLTLWYSKREALKAIKSIKKRGGL